MFMRNVNALALSRGRGVVLPPWRDDAEAYCRYPTLKVNPGLACPISPGVNQPPKAANHHPEFSWRLILWRVW
jgi:hypothetical protein